MVRPRSGPSLKKLMVLTIVLLASVLLFRKMSSVQIDLLSKQSRNRVFYEKMYTEVSNEVADWRQRYDSEYARAEQQLTSLVKMEGEARHLKEENKNLKAELARLKDTIKSIDASEKL